MECFCASGGHPNGTDSLRAPPAQGCHDRGTPWPAPAGHPLPYGLGDSNGNNTGAKPSAAEAAQALSGRGRPLRPKAQWVRYGHLPPYGTPTIGASDPKKPVPDVFRPLILEGPPHPTGGCWISKEEKRQILFGKNQKKTSIFSKFYLEKIKKNIKTKISQT